MIYDFRSFAIKSIKMKSLFGAFGGFAGNEKGFIIIVA
jgi:hypothetical protein